MGLEPNSFAVLVPFRISDLMFAKALFIGRLDVAEKSSVNCVRSHLDNHGDTELT